MLSPVGTAISGIFAAKTGIFSVCGEQDDLHVLSPTHLLMWDGGRRDGRAKERKGVREGERRDLELRLADWL